MLKNVLPFTAPFPPLRPSPPSPRHLNRALPSSVIRLQDMHNTLMPSTAVRFGPSTSKTGFYSFRAQINIAQLTLVQAAAVVLSGITNLYP